MIDNLDGETTAFVSSSRNIFTHAAIFAQGFYRRALT